MPLAKKLTKYTTATDELLISFDYQDVIDGVAYLVYYGLGMDVYDEYTLTRQKDVAGDIEYVSGALNNYFPNVSTLRDNAPSQVTNISFKTGTFSKSVTFEGEAIITYSLAHDDATAASMSFSFYKNTDLLVTESVGAPGSNAGGNFNAKATIPRTTFNEGDQLVIKATQTANSTVYFYHDPSDTAATQGTNKPSHTIFKVAMPVDIETI